MTKLTDRRQQTLRWKATVQAKNLRRVEATLRKTTRRSQRLASKLIPDCQSRLAKTKETLTSHRVKMRDITRRRQRGGPYCSGTTKQGYPCLHRVSQEGERCRYHQE